MCGGQDGEGQGQGSRLPLFDEQCGGRTVAMVGDFQIDTGWLLARLVVTAVGGCGVVGQNAGVCAWEGGEDQTHTCVTHTAFQQTDGLLCFLQDRLEEARLAGVTQAEMPWTPAAPPGRGGQLYLGTGPTGAQAECRPE